MSPTITITFTESSDFALCLASRDRNRFTSAAWVSKLLAGAALSAPEGGCYDKTEVVITDGSWTYTARIDLTREMAVQGKDILITHLQDVVRWADREIARHASGTPSAWVKKDGTGPAPDAKEAALRALGLLTFIP